MARSRRSPRGSQVNDHGQGLDGILGQPAEPPIVADGTADGSVRAVPAPMVGSTPLGNGPVPSSSTQSSADASQASLQGSLSVVSLSDLLSLLASTAQTGELRVIGGLVDGRLWLADGELSDARVGAAATMGQAIFELACLTEGWFYFTVGSASSSGHPRVPVAAVLNEVHPQVEEWRGILTVVPLEAEVTLSPAPPGHDVQIRNDQWHVLTAVGNLGGSVRKVLDEIGGDRIVGLRTLRDLHTAGLIALQPTPGMADPGHQDPPQPSSTETAEQQVASLPPPPGPAVGSNARVSSLAELAMMPPPVESDPWAVTADSDGPGDDRAG
jgi:Domain of unknown function (DUF4388)